MCLPVGLFLAASVLFIVAVYISIWAWILVCDFCWFILLWLTVFDVYLVFIFSLVCFCSFLGFYSLLDLAGLIGHLKFWLTYLFMGLWWFLCVLLLCCDSFVSFGFAVWMYYVLSFKFALLGLWLVAYEFTFACLTCVHVCFLLCCFVVFMLFIYLYCVIVGFLRMLWVLVVYY